MSIPIVTLIAAALAFITAGANLVLTFKMRRDKFMHFLFAKRLDLYPRIAKHLLLFSQYWDQIAAGKRDQYPITFDDLGKEFIAFQDGDLLDIELVASKRTLKELNQYALIFVSSSSRMEIGQLSDKAGDVIVSMRNELGLDKLTDLTEAMPYKWTDRLKYLINEYRKHKNAGKDAHRTNENR